MHLIARLFGRYSRKEPELDEELRFHVDMATEAHHRSGLSESEARRQALREFGGIETTKEYVWDENGFRWVTDLLRDVRFSFRTLRRRPAFLFSTVATIAVAIASTAIVFTAISQTLWKPLPNHRSDRIVVLMETELGTGKEAEGVSPGNLLEWRRRNSTFEFLGVAEPWSVDIDLDGRPQTLPSWQVSEQFINALGLKLTLGRIFDPHEYTSGVPSAVLLSYDAWRRLFNSDHTIVGTELVLDGASVRIIGVLPSDVGFPRPRDFWLPRPLKPYDARMRTGGWMTAVGRLTSGTTYTAAQADLDRIARALEDEQPETNKNVGVRLHPLRNHLLRTVGPAVRALGVAAIVFFLAACATVASMFSTRLHAQANELAMRVALGAGRWALLQQVFVEIFIVCFLGALAGLLFAFVLIQLLGAVLPTGLPRLSELQFDAMVVSSALGFVSVMGMCVVALSAYQVIRQGFAGLREDGRTTGRPSDVFARSVLITAQVAVASILLVGASLMVRSLSNFLDNDIGFDSDNRVALTMFGDHSATAGERIVHFRSLMEALHKVPGVIEVAATSALPFHPTQVESDSPFEMIDEVARDPEKRLSAHTIVVTPGYFSLMNIEVVQGRAFSRFDRYDTAQVAVVNRTMAQRYWPDQSAIGKKVRIRVLGVVAAREIVGISDNTRATGFDSPPRAEIFVPHAQHGGAALTIVAKTATPADRMLPVLQEAVWKNSPQQAIYGSTTVAALVAKSTEARDFAVRILTAFAFGAVGLAVLGIYSLVSYTVTLRTREFGIRMAIGATPTDIQRDATRHAFVLAVIGLIVGLAVTASIATRLQPLLYGIEPLDWPSYLGAATLIALSSLSAALLPAWRATRQSPANLLNTP